MRAALGILVVSLLAVGCKDAKSAPPASAPAVAPAGPVSIVQPELRTRAAVLETTGKVQFNEEQLVRVNAPVTGRVLEVLARPGEMVDAGQRLFVLDSPDLGQAKADYAKAVSDLERSEKALKLVRELYEVKANAEKDVRDAENDWKKAVAERERSAARLRTLGVRPEQLADIASRVDASTAITVTAPRGGIIVERNITPGQVVAYGQSDTPVNLLVIANLSTMWILADVYEPDVSRIRLGQSVRVALPCCPQDRYEGKVTNIGAAIDKDSRTLKVRSVVPNPARVLKAEMFVKVGIETGVGQALALPQSAIQRQDGGVFVFVEKAKDAFERRPIKTGAEFDGMVEILEGVTPQDRIVSTGGILLKQTVK